MKYALIITLFFSTSALLASLPTKEITPRVYSFCRSTPTTTPLSTTVTQPGCPTEQDCGLLPVHGDVSVINICSGGTTGGYKLFNFIFPNGTPPFYVSMEGGPCQEWNPSDPNQQPLVFLGLGEGDHFITFFDSLGCSILEVVGLPIETAEPLVVTFITEPGCPDGTNGKIIVSDVTGGQPNYAVTVDGVTKPFNPGDPQLEFSVPAGAYMITVLDSNGNCFPSGSCLPNPLGCTGSVRAVVCPCPTKKSKKSKKLIKVDKAIALAKAKVFIIA